MPIAPAIQKAKAGEPLESSPEFMTSLANTEISKKTVGEMAQQV